MKKHVSIPVSSSKWKFTSLIKPETYLKHLKQKKQTLASVLPKRAVICFHPHMARQIKKNPNMGFKKNLPFISHSLGSLDYYQKSQKKTLVARPIGIGAPNAVFCIEELITLGIKEFISIGTVGALDSTHLKMGTKVFLTKALRQESCSFHYASPSLFIDAHRKSTLFRKIKGLKFREATTWTTDVFYRESKEEILYFKQKNIDCVEMEAASIMAVGQYYNLPVYALAVVSDGFNGTSWSFHSSCPEVKKSLTELLEVILYL